MDSERIEKLVDFFYGSDNSTDVPFRISITTGQFSGFDLSKNKLKRLLFILSTTEDLKKDCEQFMEEGFYEREKLG